MAEKKEKKKDKYPKEETTPYNPWAVCHTTVDKDKDPEKYERCVKHIKEQNKQTNKEKSEKKEKKSAEDRLMEKVAANWMDEAGVFTKGQEPLPSEQAAILRKAAMPHQQYLQNFLQDLMDLPTDPALDLRINKIQAAVSRAMELAGI